MKTGYVHTVSRLLAVLIVVLLMGCPFNSEPSPIRGIGAITGTAMVGEVLTAGTLTPSRATADYQWKICNTQDGTFEDVPGATASTYNLESDDAGMFLQVVATGTGRFSGIATSVAKGVITPKLYAIGDPGPAGGLVFYDKGNVSDGWRYLEAAPSDIVLGESDFHHIYGYYRYSRNGDPQMVGTATAIGTGQENTTTLVNIMGCISYISSVSSNVISTEDYAARLCEMYVVETYEDWFLPSKDELILMYNNLKLADLGGFSDAYYWSSSECNAYNAQVFDFYGGFLYSLIERNRTLRVRAIRSF